MKTKLGQILMIAIVGLIGVMSADAQEHMNSFKIVGNTLESGQSLNQGEGIRSGPGNKYAAVLQRDGNFCLYKLDDKAKYGNQFVKCTMTVGDKDKQGAILTMQKDGNLVLYNAKGQPIWSTDTYRGGPDKQGGRLIVFDEGNMGVFNKSNPERAIWDFQKGRLY